MTHFRIWPAILLLGSIFLLRSLPKFIKDAPDWLWMVAVFGPILCCLLILIWWLTASRANIKEKLFAFLGLILAAAITVVGLHSTMKGPGLLTLTIPMGVAGFAGSAIFLSRWLTSRRPAVMTLVTIFCFGFSLLLRNEGMWGNGKQDFRWRWTMSAEEQMLAAKSTASDAAGDKQVASLVEVKWPGFRGFNRAGVVREATQFSSDWKAKPPKELWRKPIGPGWASFVVVDNYLYTQEQRDRDEYIVCYAADSGDEVWASLAGGRFNDPMGGPGPRATPEFSEGKLYGLTASGILVSVDARDGKSLWKVNIAEIADRKPPTWGYSSSPLVFGNLVVVHAGGDGDKGTLAFDGESGELKWSAPAGDHSYSSPQKSTLAGKEYVLMSTNKGLRLLDPLSGKVELFHDSSYRGYRTLQPQLLGDDSVLMQASGGPATYRLQVSKTADGSKFESKQLWKTTWLKSDFNDCVIHDGFLYGFNGSTLVCLDIETGERKWRGGRYGKGQVLLLQASELLLVITEQGEGLLVKAASEKHEELASMQIFEGKAWSHPVVIGNRLFLRNASEAVCYQLPTVELP